MWELGTTEVVRRERLSLLSPFPGASCEIEHDYTWRNLKNCKKKKHKNAVFAVYSMYHNPNTSSRTRRAHANFLAAKSDATCKCNAFVFLVQCHITVTSNIYECFLVGLTDYTIADILIYPVCCQILCSASSCDGSCCVGVTQWMFTHIPGICQGTI
jgi:hypothetical protein